MFTKNDFESVLNSLEFYNNRLIYVIKDGKDTVVNDLYNTFNKYVEGIKEDIALATTIKVQGLDPLPNFFFSSEKNMMYKTLITQEMLMIMISGLIL